MEEIVFVSSDVFLNRNEWSINDNFIVGWWRAIIRWYRVSIYHDVQRNKFKIYRKTKRTTAWTSYITIKRSTDTCMHYHQYTNVFSFLWSKMFSMCTRDVRVPDITGSGGRPIHAGCRVTRLFRVRSEINSLQVLFFYIKIILFQNST